MSLSLTLVSHIPYFYLFQGHRSTLKEHLLTIINGVSFCMRYGLEWERQSPWSFRLGWTLCHLVQCIPGEKCSYLSHSAHTGQYQLFSLHSCREQSELYIMPSAQPNTCSANPPSPAPLHLLSEYAITFVITLVWWSLNHHSSIPCLRFHCRCLYCYWLPYNIPSCSHWSPSI